MADARFDIEAKLPDDASPKSVNEMLQSLLEERFGLQLHREEKELPGYALVVAKTGPKMKENTDAESRGSFRMTRGRISAQKATMAPFADRLSQFVDLPVVDKTDLKGSYDFTLEWTPEESQPASTDSPSGPSVFTALQEQLGLRLQSQKLAVGIIVVDHAERVPTEN